MLRVRRVGFSPIALSALRLSKCILVYPLLVMRLPAVLCVHAPLHDRMAVHARMPCCTVVTATIRGGDSQRACLSSCDEMYLQVCVTFNVNVAGGRRHVSY